MLLIKPEQNPIVRSGEPSLAEIDQLRCLRSELTTLLQLPSPVHKPEELAGVTMLAAEYLRYILRFEVSLTESTDDSSWRRIVSSDPNSPKEVFRFCREIKPSDNTNLTQAGAGFFFYTTPGQERLKIIHCLSPQMPADCIVAPVSSKQISLPFGTRALQMMKADSDPVSSDTATISPPDMPKISFAPFQTIGKPSSVTAAEVISYHGIMAEILKSSVLDQTQYQIELLQK